MSVSSVGRRLVLGERTEEEVETVVEGAPCGAGHVGFHSYGEIAPALAGGSSDLHNQTMSVTVFSEAALQTRRPDGRCAAPAAAAPVAPSGAGRDRAAHDLRRQLANSAGADLTRIEGLDAVMTILSEIGTGSRQRQVDQSLKFK
jgi:hypothetical protein